jgi:hypothetical protein
MSDEDIDRLIEANGNLPGELMSYVFAQMTPGATLSKYNVGLLDTFDDEKKLLNSCGWRSGSPTDRTIQAKQPSSSSSNSTKTTNWSGGHSSWTAGR